ncbi:hypothetical protein ACI0FW_00965 [Alcaligenes nematophilus]
MLRAAPPVDIEQELFVSKSKPVRRKQAFEVEPLNWVAPKKAVVETDQEAKVDASSDQAQDS